MTKHIYTFGELKAGDHIFRYSVENEQVETFTVKDNLILSDKANISLENVNQHICVDKDRTYMSGRDNTIGFYVIGSDYEVKELINTTIYITKKSMGTTFNKMFNYMFKTE